MLGELVTRTLATELLRLLGGVMASFNFCAMAMGSGRGTFVKSMRGDLLPLLFGSADSFFEISLHSDCADIGLGDFPMKKDDIRGDLLPLRFCSTDSFFEDSLRADCAEIGRVDVSMKSVLSTLRTVCADIGRGFWADIGR